MPTLFLIGTPLQEDHKLSPYALEKLDQSQIVIGESRKVLDRYLKGHARAAERFHLDPPRKDEWDALTDALGKLPEDANVCLLSDVGMPILFDPGREVLEFCRKKKFKIQSVPSATSWGTACAVSGFSPPFYIHGFLTKETEERKRELKNLKTGQGHLVLMETPYRYKNLLKDIEDVFGPQCPLFLAWEIGQETERYFWGTLKELLAFNAQEKLEKGEFVLIVQRRK